MSVQHWEYEFGVLNPYTWEVVYVAGFGAIPGVCVLSDIKSSSKWTKVTGAGINGAYSTFNGDELGEATIKISITTDEDLQQLYALRRFLFPAVTKKLSSRKPFDFMHPALLFNSLRAMTVDEFVGPSQPTAEGISETTIKITQWAKPPKTSVTTRPTGTSTLGKLGDASKTALIGGPSAAGTPPPPAKPR